MGRAEAEAVPHFLASIDQIMPLRGTAMDPLIGELRAARGTCSQLLFISIDVVRQWTGPHSVRPLQAVTLWVYSRRRIDQTSDSADFPKPT